MTVIQHLIKELKMIAHPEGGHFSESFRDENNNVTVFKTNTKSKLFKLTDNLMTLSAIIFINENEIFVTTDSNKFNYYNLTNKRK